MWPDGATRCQPCAQYLSVCHWDIPLATVLVLISSQKMTLFNTHWHPTGSSTLNTATLKVKIWSLKNLFLICLLILSLGRLAQPLNTQLWSTSTADGNSGQTARHKVSCIEKYPMHCYFNCTLHDIIYRIGSNWQILHRVSYCIFHQAVLALGIGVSRPLCNQIMHHNIKALRITTHALHILLS